MAQFARVAWLMSKAATILFFGLKASIPLVLNYLGFTSVGPAAGSTAAAWMSSMGSAGVAAGSWYAGCQSAAMRGGAQFGWRFLLGIGTIILAVVV